MVVIFVFGLQPNYRVQPSAPVFTAVDPDRSRSGAAADAAR